MKPIQLLNYIFIVFFLLMSLAGFYQTITMYMRYGYSYTIVTTIGSEVTTQEMTLQTNLLIALFFLGAASLILANLLLLREKKEKPLIL